MRELSVLNPVWGFRVGPQSSPSVCLILLVITLEPNDFAITLESQDVSRDSIEEPAIVADNDRATREIKESLLKSSESIHIEIVSWLIEQYNVTSGP